MLPILIAVSACVTLALTPVAGRLAIRWGFVDHPADHKFHDRVTPLLGGLALYLGTIPAVTWLGGGAAARTFTGVVTFLFLIGLADDRRHLSVRLRLAAQAVAAAALVASGFRAELPAPSWLAVSLSFLWIVGITNAVNLLDSMDGAAPGVAVIAAAGFLALAGGSPLVLVLMSALLGALAGFLPYNLPPARIFMGDAGSMLTGLSLAVAGLEARVDGVAPSVAWMIPVLLLAVPIFDTTLVTWSRFRRGKNPMTHPGKDHFAHRLARRGLGVRGAVLCLYLLGGLSVFLAFLVSRCDPAWAWALGAAVALAALVAMTWLDRPASGMGKEVAPLAN